MSYQMWILFIFVFLAIIAISVFLTVCAKILGVVAQGIIDYLTKKQEVTISEKETNTVKPPEPTVTPQVPKQFDGLVTAIASMIARKNYTNIGIQTENDNIFTFMDMDSNSPIIKVPFTPELLGMPVVDAAQKATETVPFKEIKYAKA